jgi:hypothetical protein
VQVDKWENDRVTPTSDRQFEILAACRGPSPAIAALVKDFRAAMDERLQAMANDLETMWDDRRVTPAAAAKAVAVAHPPKRRASK